jgi:uncharacterized protein (TIGR03067 family)
MSTKRLVRILSVPLLVAVALWWWLAAVNESERKRAAQHAEEIQGVWVVIELRQLNHEPSEDERRFLESGGYKITITHEKMIHSTDQSEDEMRYRLDTTKTPPVLTLLKNGKVIAKAIYELKGDELKICQGRTPIDGAKPVPPTDFEIQNAAPGTSPSLFILQRERAKENGSAIEERL